MLIYKVNYQFHGTKPSEVTFFHMSKLLRWHELMKDRLHSVIVSIYSNGELQEKFVWNT